MTKQIKPSEMGWEEEEKEYNQVLRKAYAQKENVDAEKLLKGFRAKSTDPNGWDFLSSWTWNWIEKKLSQAYKRGREDEAIECQKDMERVVEETRREVVEEIRDWIEQNRDERPDKLFSTDSKGGNYELGRRDENIVLINELVKILDKLALSSDGEKKEEG